jgi:Ca2+-binding RTX toxin-like protein
VVSVASNRFSDAAGNFNVDGADANNRVFVSVDTLRPTIAINSDKNALGVGQTTTLSFVLNEASTDFDAADLTVSGGVITDFIGSGASYTGTFMPNPGSTTAGVVSVASNKFSDSAGNFNVDGLDANNTVRVAVNTVKVESYNITIKENTISVPTAAITDDLLGTTPKFSLTGLDAKLFTISPKGALTFLAAQDYEQPVDANHDGSYQVSILMTNPKTGYMLTRSLVINLEFTSILGSVRNDTLKGTEGFDTMDGLGGDDTLTGGGGLDTFLVTSGHDTILDFNLITMGATRLTGSEILQVSNNAVEAEHVSVLSFNNLETVDSNDEKEEALETEGRDLSGAKEEKEEKEEGEENEESDAEEEKQKTKRKKNLLFSSRLNRN